MPFRVAREVTRTELGLMSEVYYVTTRSGITFREVAHSEQVLQATQDSANEQRLLVEVIREGEVVVLADGRGEMPNSCCDDKQQH
jgi:hypothetical protein